MNEALKYLGQVPKKKPIPTRVNYFDEAGERKEKIAKKPKPQLIHYSKYRGSILKLLEQSPGPVTTAILANWLGLDRNLSGLPTTLQGMMERGEIKGNKIGAHYWWRA